MPNSSLGANCALVVAAVDGLASLGSGLGSVVHWFFEELDAIGDGVGFLKTPDWSLYAVSPYISPSSPDYSETIHAIVEHACRSRRGRFLWIGGNDSTTLSGIWSHGNPDRWREMSRSLAGTVRELCKHHDKVTVLVHGLMLASVRAHLQDCRNVQIVYVPHSLGYVFTDAIEARRKTWEHQAFDMMGRYAQDRFGYIGPYYRDVLTKYYHCDPRQLVPFVNAIPERSFRFSGSVADEQREDMLAGWSIPTGKRIVFSWGRCDPQKGFDALIPAFADFLDRVDAPQEWHLVLLAPRELASGDYAELIDEEIARLPDSSVTAIFKFNELLPKLLLGHASLEMVVFASRYEGAPLSVLEALRFGHADIRTVWHKIPSFAQFLDALPRSFPFSSLSHHEIADSLLAASRQRDVLAISDLPGSSHSANVAEGLAATLAWWLDAAAPAR